MKQLKSYGLIFLIAALQLLTQFNCSGELSNEQFEFRVKWDGRYIPDIFKISGLRRTTDVITFREGGDDPDSDRKIPGRTSYEPIVLERQRTPDMSFEEWANKILETGSDVPITDFRKDIIVEIYKANQLVMAFNVFRCWPSEYVAFSEIAMNDGDSVTIESITLQNEGWVRDTSVPDRGVRQE